MSAGATGRTLKGKLKTKCDLRQFKSRAGKEHTILDIIIIDQKNKCIEGTFWNEDCKQFFDKLKEGECYEFSGGRIGFANKQFAKTDCEYNITFGKDTTIKSINNIANIKDNIFTLRTIEEISKGTYNIVDVCALVKDISQLNITKRKNDGSELKYMKMTLFDETKNSIQMTIWGDKAQWVEDNRGQIESSKDTLIILFETVSFRDNDT